MSKKDMRVNPPKPANPGLTSLRALALTPCADAEALAHAVGQSLWRRTKPLRKHLKLREGESDGQV